ncbi:hypothetical protein KKC13_00255 [bacterium]|nr:hypothetical protein [bacterium]MBU1956793.1 hypothetical protein [bacterium]
MPFENQLNIDIKAFFFNAQTDYLPYYKNFSFTVSNETNLIEVLKLIKEQNSDFSYPDKDLVFRVNDLVVTGEEKVLDVVAELGTELTIDPALKFRSNNGLILDNHDFMHQYRRVFQRHHTTKEDLAYYMTLYPVHYASETFRYNREYIGDAILILASRMIHNGSEYKEEILEAINDEFTGIRCCEYENNLFKHKDYSGVISELKKMINITEKSSFSDKLSALTLRKKNHNIEGDSLEGANIALYTGNKTSNDLIEKVKAEVKEVAAHFVDFGMSTKLAGQTIMNSHAELAHLKAGAMFLDALDSGADILVVSDDSDLAIFRSAIARCEREVGRDIELKLISMETFNALKEKTEA